MELNMTSVKLTLGWPPSVNHYWNRTKSGSLYVCDKGVQYRKDARKTVVMVLGFDFKPFEGPIQLTLMAYPPDRRKRDLDNVLKSLMDSLQYARVYMDDYQVDELHIMRQKPILGGRIDIDIIPL